MPPVAAARPPERGARRGVPTLRVERQLLRQGAVRLAGMDEVGRGSPAGPVHVGVVVVDAATPPAPAGVRDSKLLSPTVREELVPRIERWAVDVAVASAGADEVDRFGVTGALRLAGHRALAQLALPPDLVLLDGAHDWLTTPATDDGTDAGTGTGTDADRSYQVTSAVPVVTKVRADLTCASVAAASVLAKVTRDAVMAGLALEFPAYGWRENKGYGTAGHLEALRRLGPTPHHRITWRLPGRA